MKKFFASVAIIAFLVAFSAPTFAVNNDVITTEAVADEKPKKKESETKKEDTKKDSECTKEKKQCCSEKKDKA